MTRNPTLPDPTHRSLTPRPHSARLDPTQRSLTERLNSIRPDLTRPDPVVFDPPYPTRPRGLLPSDSTRPVSTRPRGLTHRPDSVLLDPTLPVSTQQSLTQRPDSTLLDPTQQSLTQRPDFTRPNPEVYDQATALVRCMS